MGKGIIKNLSKGDKVIWVIVVLLVLMSLLLVYSSTGMLSYKAHHGNAYFFMIKRFVYVVAGLGVIYAFQNLPYYRWIKWSYVLVSIAIFILLYAGFNGANLNDASRWIKLPFLPFTIQASEPAKIALILCVTRIIYDNQGDNGLSDRGFWRVVMVAGVVCALIFWHDFSTSALLGFSCFILLVIAKAPAKLIALVSGSVIVVLIIAILLAPLLPMKVGRLQTMHNRIFGKETVDKQVKSDSDLQRDQAKIAVVSGGLLFGKGPGNSTQRNVLPHPYSDFIFAIVLEEYGYLFALGIMLLFMILLSRVGIIIQKTNSVTGAFVVAGLGSMIVLQGLINMAVSTNSMPITGQPMPFVSMGGSSLLFTCMAIGIILNVSKIANESIEENNNRE